MLKVLTASALALLLVGCGGPDESEPAVAEPATTTTAIGQQPPPFEELPIIPAELVPRPVFVAEFDADHSRLEIKILNVPPAEERFFFDAMTQKTAPKLEAPPCPACVK